MDITPKALREAEFREKKFGGYHPDDVDEFIEKVAVALEILQERLRQVNERAARAEQRASEVGEGDEAMRRTLVLAQRTADLALEEARQQAAAIVGEAHDHAERIGEESTRQLRGELSNLEAHREQLWSDVAVLGRWLQEERGRLRLAFGDVVRRLDLEFPQLQSPPVLPDPHAAPTDEQGGSEDPSAAMSPPPIGDAGSDPDPAGEFGADSPYEPQF